MVWKITFSTLDDPLNVTISIMHVPKCVMGAMPMVAWWLSNRVLHLRLQGHWFETLRRHFVLEQDTLSSALSAG